MDRDQPGVCLCGIHPRIPILSFLEDPRLGFRLVLLFGRAAPKPLGSISGAQIPLSDAFKLLLGGATTAGLLLATRPWLPPQGRFLL